MRKKLITCVVVFILCVILYWIGVYLSGIPIKRSMDIAGNYGFSLLISIGVAGIVYACPAWDDEKGVV